LGVLGVELFYALSGFLIGGLLLDLEKAGGSWRDIKIFIVRRWLRTLPLYYLTFLALLSFPILDPAQQTDPWSYAVMGQNLFSPMPTSNWFGPSWSLTIEEWSYLLLPFLAFGLCRGSRHAVLYASLLMMGMGLFWRLLLTDPTEAWDETVRKMVIIRIDAIAYGVLFAWGQRYLKLKTYHRSLLLGMPLALGLIGLTLFICSTRFEPPFLLQSFYARVLMLTLTGLALASLVPLALSWSAPSWIEMPIKYIARWSYAMYLVHWSFLFLLDKAPSSSQWVLFISGTLMTAALLSHFIEQPILRKRPRQVLA
jgi:peptidoglycan/LPS O-acetylase OafA/YrhL